MAVKIVWKPVLQVLALKDYHPDYGDEKIMVCVNPQPEFWREYTRLLSENARQYADADLHQKAASAALNDDERRALEISAGAKATEYMVWIERTFIPSLDSWFAKLWSFGEDKYTLEDVTEFQNVDEHFLTWAKARSIEMINGHASAKKKV